MWIIDWLRDVLTNFLASIGFLNKEADIILIGLDNAGKTTLLSRLANDAFEMFPPTERPRKDEFQVAGVRFRAWDLGGHEAVRQVWDDFLPTTGGVVFVVDAADADRLQECEDELSALALDTQLYGVPMAVLFNKSDLPFALSDEELFTALEWTAVAQREGPTQAFRTSVLNGTGYTEALQWLAQHI
mmetsp:Transcript_16779/g.48865  ORF Transcript_16779/g.48865 Transcript_16779/m.48865 type:complete len:187 (-) Transcript_16779:402-962(-)